MPAPRTAGSGGRFRTPTAGQPECPRGPGLPPGPGPDSLALRRAGGVPWPEPLPQPVGVPWPEPLP